MVKGNGLVYAKRLPDAFDTEVFGVVEQTLRLLRNVPGISEKRAKKITWGWVGQKVICCIMVSLHAHDVSTSRVVRTFKTYGDSARVSAKKDEERRWRDAVKKQVRRSLTGSPS